MAKHTGFFVLLFILIIPAYAETASDVANSYFKTIQAKQFDKASQYFHTDALTEFRQLMEFVNTLPSDYQGGFIPKLFGENVTMALLMKMSNQEFFAAFLSQTMKQIENAEGLDFNNMQVLGEVVEGDSITHVVTRNFTSIGAMQLEAIEVLSFRKENGEWKALMTGKVKGLALQIRSMIDKAY